MLRHPSTLYIDMYLQIFYYAKDQPDFFSKPIDSPPPAPPWLKGPLFWRAISRIFSSYGYLLSLVLGALCPQTGWAGGSVTKNKTKNEFYREKLCYTFILKNHKTSPPHPNCPPQLPPHIRNGRHHHHHPPSGGRADFFSIYIHAR